DSKNGVFKNLIFTVHYPPLLAGVIGSINFRIMLVRTCSPQPILARLWRVLVPKTLARGEQDRGCGQNVLTSSLHFLEPITPDK
ncbi:MAG: hypothetical protein AB8G86_10955, partial [Saprospiraceae bacterium]